MGSIQNITTGSLVADSGFDAFGTIINTFVEQFSALFGNVLEAVGSSN